ncbi:MAG: DUF6799 domain-containing protein [Chthoniobacter sp.]|uniref:DUF6799 domain-containing protein n=1 Tax=Chthoniobacter sp. TaxID=2510640 RepID=UPI0032ACB794
MITKTSKVTRVALALTAMLCLGSSVMAGPDPMYIMYGGKMMKLSPMTKDVTLANGCKVCFGGTVTDKKGKTVTLKNGDVVGNDGSVMTPAAKKAHGG